LARARTQIRGSPDPEQRRFDLVQTAPVAADPERHVVVEERLGEPDDRVGEGAWVDRRLVRRSRHLGLDQAPDARHRPRLDRSGARGQQTQRAAAFLLEQRAQRRRLRKAPVDAVEHIQQPACPSPPRPCPMERDEPLELGRNDLAEQQLA
jgi:hypothetical protein